MSVAAFNKFALLNDDADGTTSSKLTTATSKATSTSVAPAPTTTPESKSKTQGPAARSGRYYTRGGAPPKSSEPRVTDDANIPPARFDRTEGRHERGRGRGERGRGGPRGGGYASKDRHSRTAIVDSDKQVNQGWGADTGVAELANESQGAADAQAEAAAPAEGDAGATWGLGEPAADWGTPGDDAAPATSGEKAAEGEGQAKAEKVVQEEDRTITYEEYLAKKSGAGLADLVGSTETRVANDGKNTFKDATKFERDEEEESYFVGKTKAARTRTKTDKPEKVTIEIDGQFSEPPGGFGGRGRGRGRGDFRGGRGGDFRGGRGGGGGSPRGEFRGGRGGGRGGYRNQQANGTPAVNVDDQSAFPTLDRPAKSPPAKKS